MTTDSVWLIERVYDDSKAQVCTVPPFPNKVGADEYAETIKVPGCTYRAVEYRRVKEGE